mgnify:FL=1
MRSEKKTILLATPRGFCAGVERAIEIVEKALQKFGAPVYVRHEIVHNKYVVNSLAKKGAVFVEELDEVPKGAPVIFSAHGVAKSVRQQADVENMIAIDATCPLVTKVHNETIRHYQKGKHTILIGHYGHPEVAGTMGQVPDGEITLIETAEDALNFEPKNPDNLAFATQTTLSVDGTSEIISILQHRFPKITGPSGEDICYATTNRQNAVKKLAEKSEYFIIIGANNSSNSKRLVEVALKFGAKKAVLIPDANSLDLNELRDVSVISISSGASVPEILVNELIQKLDDEFEISIQTDNSIKENVTFNLPSILKRR